MRGKALLVSALAVLISLASAQTMFRDFTYGEACTTALAKLRRAPDFKQSDGTQSSGCDYRSSSARFALSGWFDQLFGQRDVYTIFWIDRNPNVLSEIVFGVAGIEGIDFIDTAIEGFTSTRGEPDFRRRVDASEMLSHGNERTEVVARWVTNDGIVVTVEAYAHPSMRNFDGRVRVAFEKPLTPRTTSEDARQF